MTNLFILSSPLRRRALQLVAVFGLSAAATVTFPEPAQAGTPGVCPTGSQGDRAFKMTNLDDCVWVNNDHNKMPKLYETVDYNIYCPGRIPVNDGLRIAKEIGKKITGGESIRNQDKVLMNPITEQHAARNLVPQFVSSPHVYHYGCHLSGVGNGVATHIKVRVKALPKPGGGGEPKCKAFGSQNGDIALNARMDRVYKCTNPQFHSSNRGGFDSLVKTVSTKLLKASVDGVQSDVAKAKALGGKVCLLPSTDIQCAPCTWSDKLIVRVQTVPVGKSCPAGSKEVR